MKIKKGMPANQVKAAIGQPHVIEKYKSYSVYDYTGYGGEGSLRVIFEPNGTVTDVVEDGLHDNKLVTGRVVVKLSLIL